MYRVFRPEFCDLETEQLIVAIAREHGFPSLVIGELYEALVTQGIYSSERLRAIASFVAANLTRPLFFSDVIDFINSGSLPVKRDRLVAIQNQLAELTCYIKNDAP